jgi:hypothetical protein
MAQLDRLMRDARKAMRSRGHNPVTDWKEAGRGMLHCCNEGCNQGVTVIVKPQPNEIQIGGEALASNCNVTTCSKEQFAQALELVPTDAEFAAMYGVMGC